MTIRSQQDTSSFQLLDKDQNELPQTKYVENTVSISNLSYTTLSFHLRALVPGKVKLQFVASSGSLKDVIEHDIKVLPESLLFTHQMFSYKKLTSQEKQSNFTLQLRHPHSIDGVKCYITSKTIILQLHSFRSFQLIDNAEQSISKLISVYYLYDYVRLLDTSASQKWMNYLEDNLNDGYQSLLRFRIPKEGFRYDNFTQNGCSSTWVTCFALQAIMLLQATPVEIEEHIITETEDFLLSRRKNSTIFWEPCKIPNRRTMDELELSIEILKTLQNSTRFLNLQSTNNWISQELLKNQSIHLIAKRGSVLPTWKAPVWVSPENWTVERRDLETAGRILTMQLKREIEPENILYIWILAKLFGQPSDCYECSIAEQAVYQRTKLLMNPETHKIKISVYGDDIKQQKTFDLDSHEELMLQKVSLQTKENVINFKANGLGQLLVRCSYEYEVKVTEKSAANQFQLRINQLNSNSLPAHQIKLMICIGRNRIGRFSYVGTEVTVELPSGYTLDSESVYQLSLKPQVRVCLCLMFPIQISTFLYQLFQMSSSEQGGTQLRVSLGAAPATKFLCGVVICQRDYSVLNLKPGLISAYDTNSENEPEVFAFELKSESASSFNESTTSDSDNDTSTTPTFDVETSTSTEGSSTPNTPNDILKFANPDDQLSNAVSTTETIDISRSIGAPFSGRFQRSIDDPNNIASLLAPSDSNSDYSTAV